MGEINKFNCDPFMPSLTFVVAATAKNGIGLNGTMPWRIPKDLKYFSQVTSTTPTTAQMNAVFMGRKTWESIPLKFRPLRKRINVVLSRNKNYELCANSKYSHPPWLIEPIRFPDDTAKPADPTYLYSDLKTAVQTLGLKNSIHRLFIIGGASVYQEALQCPSLQADRILITRIYEPEFECDVFFPDVLGGAEWRRASHEEHNAWVGFDVPSGIQTENGIKYEFQMWVRT